MRTMVLGHTGIQVSALCLGTDAIGSRIDYAASLRLLDHFYDAGGTFIDTANFYASWVPECRGGESESVIGRWLKDRNCRSRVVIASKVGFEYPGCKGGLSAGEITRECEKSLQRLHTDYLDLYFAHRDDFTTPQDETMEAFHRLAAAGKIRAAGASNLFAWRIAQANTLCAARGWTPFGVVQQRFTYLRPRHGAKFGPQICINDDVRGYCCDHGIPMMGYAMLLGGAYVRPDRRIPSQYAGPDTDERLAVLREVAAEKGATVHQVILAWAMQSKPAILPIIAGSRTEQLSENIAALDLTLSDEQMLRLDNAGDPVIDQSWLR